MHYLKLEVDYLHNFLEQKIELSIYDSILSFLAILYTSTFYMLTSIWTTSFRNAEIDISDH